VDCALELARALGLLDLFLALVVAVAFLRLYGPRFGVLAALAWR
jgi:hypothetical protein